MEENSMENIMINLMYLSYENESAPDNHNTGSIYSNIENYLSDGTDDAAEDNLINHSFLVDKQKYKIVLDDSSYAEIFKTTKYMKTKEIDTCPIMSTVFEDQQEIITLPCKHIFEPSAIMRWMREEKAECPVCRYNDFKTKEIKIEQVKENISAPATSTRTPSSTASTLTPNDLSDINRYIELYIRYQDYTEYTNFMQSLANTYY